MGPVAEWIDFIHAPRDDFAATMTEDEAAARRIMEEDPAIASGIAKGELRPFSVALLRGRD